MTQTITGDHASRMKDYMPIIAIDRAAFNQGANAKFDFEISDSGINSTLVSMGPSAVAYAVKEALTASDNSGKTIVYAIGDGQANQTRLSDKAGALNCMHDQQAVMYPTITTDAGTSGNNQSVLCVASDVVAGFNGYKSASADLQYQLNKSPTIEANMPSNIVKKVPVKGYIVRRLTPLEGERLQGYPDGWTDIGPWVDDNGKLHKESSDSARYRVIGNSLALPCAARVVRGIAKAGRNRRC